MPHYEPALPLDPRLPLRVDTIGTPIHSERLWTTAIAPNARGGWNFITQAYEHESNTPTEFFVVDLDAGTFTASQGTPGAYAASKFQIANQLRAPNGRIFFPLSGMRLAYYDPETETVQELPPLLDPKGPDQIIYDAKFGPDGMLYAGTQSNALPTILQIDPNTLKVKVLGHVGREREQYSYAYQIAVEPPWVYATVGEAPWELAALNITTGESKILAKRPNGGWMKLEARAEGLHALMITRVHTAQAQTDHGWLGAGKLEASDASSKPRMKRRAAVVKTPELPPNAPEVDTSALVPDANGICHVRWRPAGTDAWRDAEFGVQFMMPIPIEALGALPGGGIFGGTQQYHGFFRFDPASASMTVLAGAGPSRPAVAAMGDRLYFAGYPGGALYVYDPQKPWALGATPKETTAKDANPRMLGSFTASGTKYGAFLAPWGDRLFYLGRRERDGIGAGIGYYEPATGAFAGTYNELGTILPRGFAVVPDLGRVVVSGKLLDGSSPPAQAELFVFDRDLHETDHLAVKPGLADTGRIFATGEPGIIVGVIPDQQATYRYDLAAKKLLAWAELPGKIDAVVQRPDDGTIWAIVDGSLVRIDVKTLQPTTFGQPHTLPGGVELVVWQGADLYFAIDSDLMRIARVGLP